MSISTPHPERKQAIRIHWRKGAVGGGGDLGPDDLVCVNIGSLTENSDMDPAFGGVRLAHPRDQMGAGHRHHP